MNTKERVEWLEAWRSCFPGLETSAMAASAAAIDGPGRWEVSVRGGGMNAAGLRFFGEGDYTAWKNACAETFSLGLVAPRAPLAGFPWLSAVWDLRSGRWESVRLCGEASNARLKNGQALAWDYAVGVKAPQRRRLSPTAFKAGVFQEPALDRALEEFSRLCPVASFSFENTGWSLRLARPLRWPLFARCDLSAAFTPDSTQLALFLLDRSVVELSFDGEALWAHCSG